MKNFKLNATTNNIKNLVVSAITLILLLVLFLGIGLAKKLGNEVTYIRGFNQEDGLTGLYKTCAVIIIICATLGLLMSLIGMFMDEQMTKSKMVMDALTKIMMIFVIILSIVILVKFAGDTKEEQKSVTSLTYAFMIIFGMAVPLAAIIINFDKTIYFKN